ncbi:hypothetical protein [Hymenobacter segetis]|uniref:Uncharacterized protein n=1 Tax=Hymenobacter segetis TaxID=2025509 RepID=A0ABU9LRY2_9BACT
MKFLLKIKHWQLFTLLFIPVLTADFVTISTHASGDYFSFRVFAAMLLLFVGVFFSWLYALATGLQQKLPPTVSMNITRFKIALFIPSAYITLIIADMFGAPLGATNGLTASALAVIIPLHLLSMAGIFYCIYFNAKSLKATELQRPVVFADYLGEIFIIWFFPIGIWAVQPRINALFGVSSTNPMLL